MRAIISHHEEPKKKFNMEKGQLMERDLGTGGIKP